MAIAHVRRRAQAKAMLGLVITHSQLLRYAGLFTYSCVGVLLLLLKLGQPGSVPWLWLSYVAFGMAYWALMRDGKHLRRSVQTLFLLMMTLSALLVTYLSKTGLAAVLLMVSASAIASSLPLRPAIVWLLAQNLAMLPIVLVQPELSWLESILTVSMYLGCSTLVFITALVAHQQMRERDQLLQINLELQAAQAMLSETERTAERLRISRELHDLVGHHLTALSINLEVASHVSEGKARKHVQQAQAISKLLLADVREVVSQLREGDAMNLDAALQALAEAVPQPQVHLQLPKPFVVPDAPRAHVILRLAQEIITNTVKHASARNLWLRFSLIDAEERGVEISAYDDGRGAADVRAGNGLNGMRERLAAFGGTLMCESTPTRGFNVAAFLPLPKKLATITE
jgi:signal transduction histidine kinase